MNMEPFDHVDDCMQMLGSSLNLLDPDDIFSTGIPSEELLIKIMQAVKDDYRKLSDAIHALRASVTREVQQ